MLALVVPEATTRLWSTPFYDLMEESPLEEPSCSDRALPLEEPICVGEAMVLQGRVEVD